MTSLVERDQLLIEGWHGTMSVVELARLANMTQYNVYERWGTLKRRGLLPNRRRTQHYVPRAAQQPARQSNGGDDRPHRAHHRAVNVGPRMLAPDDPGEINMQDGRLSVGADGLLARLIECHGPRGRPDIPKQLRTSER